MRVDPVENSDIPPGNRTTRPRLDETFDKGFRLLFRVRRRQIAYGLPRRIPGEKALLKAPPGPAHDARGDAEYRPARAVILLETKYLSPGKSALELQDVLHAGAPPAVDALIVIPHGEHAPMAAR